MAEQNPTFCGVLLLDKPQGVSSHDMVGFTRRMFNTRQVGHAGTLDPMATGVLPIMVGRATKLSQFLSDHDKTYEAILRLGITTDTGDMTGTVLSECSKIPSFQQIEQVAKSFVGDILQTPPMYSALKRNGQKLVDLARQGIEVEREARPIQIYSLLCEPTDTLNQVKLTVHCGKGTYIRTLCEDIGKALGCGGTMAALRRTTVEQFQIDSCVSKEGLESMTFEERLARLLPVQTCFPNWPTLKLPLFYEKLYRNGCAILLTKIKVTMEEGRFVLLFDANSTCYSVGQIIQTQEGLAVKSVCLLETT